MKRALAIGAAIVLAYLAVIAGFRIYEWQTLRTLASKSLVAPTGRGPVEYALRGSGPVVLVLPGSFGGYDQALDVGRSLEGLGYRVLAVSRPGYLRTSISVGRTPREQAAAFVTLLDSLRLDRVAVVAVSGGGPAALELASAYPNRVWGLVLISCLSGPKDQPPARALGSPLAQRLLGESFSTWWQLRKLERSGVQALDAPIFTADTRARLAKSPELLRGYFRLAWYRFPPSARSPGYLNDRAQFARFEFDRFDAITAPTLVVHGTGDRNVPIAHGDRSAGRIPNASYLKVDGGDHFLTVARPDWVWGRVGDFLGPLRPGA